MHYCFVTGLYSRTDSLMYHRQGKSLVYAGYKVTYVVCDDLPDETIDGIHIISTRYKPSNRLNRFFKTKNVIKKYIDIVDADIYQISDPELLSLVSYIKQKNKKVVFNLREYYPDLLKQKAYIPQILKKPIASLYAFFMTKYLKRYDAVFAVADWMDNILKVRHGVKNTCVLTNFPIVNDTFTLTKEEYMKRENIICYIGSIYTRSHQEIIFDALSKIPNVKYLLAGRFEDDVNYVNNHPYWPKVEFINGFPRSEMGTIMGRAIISNTLRDFMGRDGSYGVIKIFESMEQGLPVLLSDVPLHQHIVAKYSCGICVNPLDSNAISAAIQYLINNKEEAYEMGKRGREAVLNEFNWQKQAKKYIDVISHL